jgi:hypothetical protein
LYLNKYYRCTMDSAIRKIKRVRPIAFSNGYTFKQLLGK